MRVEAAVCGCREAPPAAPRLELGSLDIAKCRAIRYAYVNVRCDSAPGRRIAALIRPDAAAEAVGLPAAKKQAPGCCRKPSRFRRPGGGSDEPQGASHAMRDGCRGCRGARRPEPRHATPDRGGADRWPPRRCRRGAARTVRLSLQPRHRAGNGAAVRARLVAQPESLSTGALSGMFPFAATLALVALGQTLVIQQGGIDLSVPGVVSLSGVIVSY